MMNKNQTRPEIFLGQNREELEQVKERIPSCDGILNDLAIANGRHDVVVWNFRLFFGPIRRCNVTVNSDGTPILNGELMDPSTLDKTYDL